MEIADYDKFAEENRETFMIDFELGRRYFVKIERFKEIPPEDTPEYLLYIRYKDFTSNQLTLIRNHLNSKLLKQLG